VERTGMIPIRIAILAALAVSSAASAATPVNTTFYEPAYVIGSPTAKVTVEEYASPTCPHCARFDAQIFPQIKQKYVDTGRVKFVFREFLTEPVALAASSYIVARCAGKSNYYKFIEDVFRAQPEMASGKPGTEPVVVLMRIAKTYGLDADKFHTCLADPKAVSTLGERLDHAMNVDNVDGTPTVIVNGKKVDPGLGEWTLEKIAPAIEQALHSAR
jgi:protein-disulfide isomerase